MRLLFVLPIVLTLNLFHAGGAVNQDNDSNRSLAQWQQKWIDDFQHRNATILKDLLADDFIYTSESTTLGKREFILLAEKLDLSKRRIELTDTSMRVYGSAAFSTGAAVLRPQADDPIKGESKSASRPVMVNLGEISRPEGPPSSTGKRRGVPTPMPVLQDRPEPGTEPRYRYTAMYAKFRGRWQMVALHLSRAAPD